MRTANSARKNLATILCLASSLSPLGALAALEPIEGVPSKSLTDILSSLTKWVLEFGIALCVILMIWGGITYIASTGDEERIVKSKKTIHYAIYGLAIIGFSFAMIKVINDVLK